MTTPPTKEDIPAVADLVLDLKELSESPSAELPGKFEALPDTYEAWIENERRKISDPDENLADHAEAAEAALLALAQSWRPSSRRGAGKRTERR